MKNWIVMVVLGLGGYAGSTLADDIRLGEAQYGGTGCPAGSASVTLSPDAKSLSILFDAYSVEAGGYQRSINRKACNVAIPVHVPQGLSVSIFEIDYRGYNSLPVGGSSQFNVEYFFAGQRGPRMGRTFYGALDDDFLINNRLAASAIVWSRCGEDVILRANTSMRVASNRHNEEALSSVDSMDAKAGVIYQLQWKRCY